MISGCECKPVSFPEFWKCTPIYFSCLKAAEEKTMSQVIAGDEGAKDLNLYKEFLREIFTGKTDFTKHVLFYAILETIFPKPNTAISNAMLQLRDDLIAEFDRLLGDNGIFILPSYPEAAPKHGTTFLKVSNINYFTMLNILGLPTTHCPIGLDEKTGCPLGIQIAANPFNDHLTIEVAQDVEKLFGGWAPPFKS